ncbi:MBL fold metallo-hydrolase [Amycolatopsis sp. YIM 10]|uniref:MBL fold metallo-hydrolase n=1 Tax=Amycolatopsis sp. YIM 10 TaxID=2653857 RepID=UPI0012907F7A|nr:MBL fold metallo-hydrolase [Amycolatopsis sp. YIM 10]QFU90813.1 Ribonuclease BN [Amycolatopsis sp. YIM 10]
MASASSNLSVTVLGARTPYPVPGQPCSGYLLRGGHRQVWVDAGSGTLAELQRHTTLAEIDAILISHLHPDHSADLVAAWNAYANDEALPRPRVLGPAGWAARLDGLLGAGAAAQCFHVEEIDDAWEGHLDDLELKVRRVQHSEPTLGLRATRGGRVFFYSADSGPCPALAELARSADLAIVEAGAATPQNFHLTPEEAASICREAAVGKFVLTHLAAGLAVDHALSRARTAFGGTVHVAEPGRVFKV